MKRRWKILIAIAIFASLMAASLTVTMRVQPAREVDAYKKFLRDKGEKLELNEVLPPPALPDENSVDSVQTAFSIIGSSTENIPDAMVMVAPGRAFAAWQQADVRGWNFTNSWDEFAASVEVNRPAVQLLHQVLDHPKLDFQLDYKKGAQMLLPHLAPMRRSAQILDTSAIYELHVGDTAAATTNILTLLAIVQRDVRDELLISHLVRIAITTIAVSPTWELLQATNVTDVQLAAVQSSWQQLNFLKDAENAFEIERITSDVTIERSRSSHEEFEKIFPPMTFGSSFGGSSSGSSGWADVLENFTASPRAAIGEAMWRSSWSYSAELHVLRDNQVILESLRAMQTNQTQFYKTNYDAMSSRLSTLGYTNTGGAFFSALRIPDFRVYFRDGGLSSSIRRTLQIETARRVVVTAIALKRFQLRHGVWPQTLNELTPEFIASVPIDPFDGKPLKYHPNPDGTYLLYSVGEDGADDGGDATPTKSSFSGSTGWYWLRARDWVWPQPATPAEMQYFYEHPPK